MASMDGNAAAGRLQAVDWDGAVNAWRIAGDVYRMGRHEWVTEAGWRQMYDDGVRTVIDLRASRERRQRDTDPQVPDDAKARIAVVHCPTEDPDHSDFGTTFGPYLNEPGQYAEYLAMFGDKIARVFKAIAASPGKVVVHCSAGRDRSGMIALILQRLAGIEDGEILRGYELAARGINERHRTHGAPHAHDLPSGPGFGRAVGAAEGCPAPVPGRAGRARIPCGARRNGAGNFGPCCEAPFLAPARC